MEKMKGSTIATVIFTWSQQYQSQQMARTNQNEMKLHKKLTTVLQFLF